LGIPATIVMPEHTPFVKVANTEAFGAEVVLSGRGLYEAQARAMEIAEERGLVVVHPYDDPRIIAGQGTIALEVLADIPDLDMIVVPIGGGGLIAGNAIAAHAIKPDLAVIGVCSAACPSMHAALAGETLVCSEQTLADGIAVKAPGKLTLPIVKDHVSGIVLVDEPAVERAICALLGLQKIIAEGAGAASLAALLTEPERFRGRKLCLYLTGGNIDPRMLASVVVRGLEREGKIVSLRLTITDQPGVLGRVATILGASGANILEVFHRRTMLDVPARGATLDLMIETKDKAHASQAIGRLEAEGFQVSRLEGWGGRVTGGS
jgi:threonine dehydratase